MSVRLCNRLRHLRPCNISVTLGLPAVVVVVVYFVVNKNIAHNMTIASGALSDRMAQLRVCMKKCYQVKCIHVSLPQDGYSFRGFVGQSG